MGSAQGLWAASAQPEPPMPPFPGHTVTPPSSHLGQEVGRQDTQDREGMEKTREQLKVQRDGVFRLRTASQCTFKVTHRSLCLRDSEAVPRDRNVSGTR